MMSSSFHATNDLFIYHFHFPPITCLWIFKCEFQEKGLTWFLKCWCYTHAVKKIAMWVFVFVRDSANRERKRWHANRWCTLQTFFFSACSEDNLPEFTMMITNKWRTRQPINWRIPFHNIGIRTFLRSHKAIYCQVIIQFPQTTCLCRTPNKCERVAKGRKRGGREPVYPLEFYNIKHLYFLLLLSSSTLLNIRRRGMMMSSSFVTFIFIGHGFCSAKHIYDLPLSSHNMWAGSHWRKYTIGSSTWFLTVHAIHAVKEIPMWVFVLWVTVSTEKRKRWHGIRTSTCSSVNQTDKA